MYMVLMQHMPFVNFCAFHPEEAEVVKNVPNSWAIKRFHSFNWSKYNSVKILSDSKYY